MHRADVLVIGGGVAGCAASYYLARHGLRVTLLERDKLNAGASGQNAGSLHFQLEFRQIAHGSKIAEQHAVVMPLNLDAMATWTGLDAELGVPLGVLQHGGLMVAETDEDVETLQRKHLLEREWGLECEFMSGSDARAREPGLDTTIAAAEYVPSEGHANPRLVAPGFAAAAQRLGASVRTGDRVVALTRTGTAWRAVLSSGEVLTADAAVIATGSWSPELLGMVDFRIPVVPVALTMLVTAKTRPTVHHLIQHAGRRLSLKQTEDGNVLIGGGWPSLLVQRAGRVDLDARPGFRYESIVGNAATAAHVIPALRGLPVIRSWTGTTELPVDGVPLVGEVPRRPGLYLLTATGFTLAPTLARETSRLIAEGKTDLPLETFSPRRFAHLNFT